MRISFEWTEREWDEAVQLANRTSVRRQGLPGMTYALVGIPLVGAVLDFRSTVRSSKGITLAGSILPLLLILVAVTGAVLIAVVSLTRKRKRDRVADIPDGEWELVFQEAGWRCTSRDAAGSARDLSSMDGASFPENAPAITTAAEPNTVAAARSADSRGTSSIGTPDPLPALSQQQLRPWSELLEARQGDRVIVFMHRTGFAAIPTRSLTPEQGGHMHRMVARKLKPGA